MEKLKVGGKTDPAKLAGAIAGFVREDGGAKLQAIGAAAVNQAVKGVAIARGFLAPQGVEICILPGFHNVEVDDQDRTVINLEVRRL